MTLTPEQLARCRRILDFWYRVEFFIPFDLQGHVLDAWDANWSVRRFSLAQLDAISASKSGGLWHVARVPEGRQLSGFDLYLGVFDIGQSSQMIKKAVQEIVPESLSPVAAVDQEERAILEGLTCFAKMKLKDTGEPLLDEVSVSSLPWAVGHAAHGGLAALDFDRFQHSLGELNHQLHNFNAMRAHHDLALSSDDIKALLQIFYDWAGFSVDHQSVAIVIRARAGKKIKPKTERAVSTNPANEKSSLSSEDLDEIEEEDEEDENPPDHTLDILNSFYAKDIQQVIHALDRGEINDALFAYLTPLADDKRLDLYSAAGRDYIAALLHPHLTPAARWFSESHHAMSLMQQFSINALFQTLQKPGLFSVNGPPGTGKTTLLRDIFAENITRRARKLASFERATAALDTQKKMCVSFEGREGALQIAPLNAELTGFEMVVASSNNGAVENISRDLPKTKAIGAKTNASQFGANAWRHSDGAPKHTYLQSVAWRIAAQNSKGGFDELSVDDIPWGLMCATLGKKENRYRFSERLNFSPKKENEPDPPGYDPAKHQTIWQWRKEYKGPRFSEARQRFLKLDAALNDRVALLESLAQTRTEIGGHDAISFCQNEQHALIDAQYRFDDSQRRLATIKQSLATLLEKIDDLREVERLLLANKPVWWKRWIHHHEARRYRIELAETRDTQRQHLHDKLSLRDQLDEVEKVCASARLRVNEAHRTLKIKEEHWATLQSRLHQLHEQLPQACCPTDMDQLEDRAWQIAGIWQDHTLNRLRSKLFAAALDLHQAWLAEVMQEGNGPFARNVIALSELLKGRRLVNPEHALSIWQSLFMIVPIVSSTFASIATQFRHIGCNALGWLIIDEAGQAVPQAAVGALWRCRHAVVVGDPLQIEPVFTVPIQLIEALAVGSELQHVDDVKPHKTSAQHRADLANSLGTWVTTHTDEKYWIGSPLRVHRRCIKPIFNIANSIAYDGKMVYGLQSDEAPSDSINLGPSSWIHIAGRTSKKQVVPEQIHLVLAALIRLHQSLKQLPPLYIVSPFKQIKTTLIDHISDLDNWGSATQLPDSKTLRTWCRERIGTVHTFQGKEESIVWMVLGCDQDNNGGAHWASDKPNLLNVAVTRAQHRLFIMGDAELWGSKKYFYTAKQSLTTISPAEFLERMAFQDASLEESYAAPH